MADEKTQEKLNAMQGLPGSGAANAFNEEPQEAQETQEAPQQQEGEEQPQEPQEPQEPQQKEQQAESFAERMQREAQEGQEQAQQQETEQPQEETPEQESQEGQGEEGSGEEKDPLEDNPLIKARRAAAAEEGSIESMDDLQKRAQSELGVESEKPEDLLNQFKQVKQKADSLEEVQKERDQIKDLFEQLPEDLSEAVTSYFESGTDPREVLNSRPNLDFSKTEQDIPEKELLNAYFPDEFSEEDTEAIRNGEADERLQKAYKVTLSRAQENFRSDKEKFSQKQQDRDKRMKQYKENFDQSLNATLQTFSDKFPGADQEYVDGVKQYLENPALLFYNEDGTLKQDAAVKIALAQNGYELVDRYVQQQRTEAKNEARREEVKKYPQQPDPNKTKGTGKGQGSEVSPEVKKKLDDLSRLKKPNTF